MKRIKYYYIIMILVVTVLFTFAGVAGAQNAVELEPGDLESFLDGVMSEQWEEYKFGGAVLTVVHEGEIIFNQGYGYKDREERIPVDPDSTLFRPGSVSKLFTWTAVMQMVERGEIDLEDDVNEYLDFEIPETYRGSSQVDPIKIKHLLTHTPGFEDTGENLFAISEEDFMPLEEYLEKNLPARVFPPGELAVYSNYGTSLAGYIVELVSGLEFEEYVKQNIFAPLDMENSSFYQPLPENLAEDLAKPYNFVDGEFVEGSFEFMTTPAGGLSATGQDMANFMLAHLQDGVLGEERILAEDTINLMHENQFAQHPELKGLTYGFFEENYNGKRVISHGGDSLLYHSGLFLVPEEDVGLFVSYSGANFMARERLIQSFMDRYYPEETVAEIAAFGEQETERAQKYVGEYHSLRRNFTTIEKLMSIFEPLHVELKDDYLVVNFMGESNYFVEEEPGHYRNRRVEGVNLLENVVFSEKEKDQIIMSSDGVMNFSKAPWYETSSFLAMFFSLTLLILCAAVLFWVIRYILILYYSNKYSSRRSRTPIWVFASRLTTGLFTLTLGGFITGLMVVLSDIKPAFGVPRMFFEEVPLLNYVLYLPLVMLVLAVIMVGFTVYYWLRRQSTGWSSKLFYSLLTLIVVGFLLLLNNFNLLFVF